MPRAVPAASDLSTSIVVGEPPSDDALDRSSGGICDGSRSQYNGRQRQKNQDPARDLSIQVLEKFSLVTKFARETTSQIFREINSDGYGAIERKRHDQSPDDYLQKESAIAEKVPIQAEVATDPLEVTISFVCLTLHFGVIFN